METILTFIHDVVMWIITILVFIAVDLPLKIMAIIFVLLLGVVLAIFCPLFKKYRAPMWIGIVYDYAAKPKQLIASSVRKLWSL